MSMQAPIVSEYSLSKLILIDEAWDLLSGSHPQAGKFINKGYRTSRKHGGSFVTMTAMPADYKHDIADTIFQNTTVQSVGMLTKEYV